MTVLRPKKEVFYGIYLFLLPFIWLLPAIFLAIGYFKKDAVFSLEKVLLVFGSLSIIPLFLSIIFLCYKLTFDEEKVTYQNFLTKKELRFDEIDYARFEHGYKDRSEKPTPSSRFVIYPKSHVDNSVVIINCWIFKDFKVLVKKVESQGKLKRTKSYTH